jgi:hypothetical protein
MHPVRSREAGDVVMADSQQMRWYEIVGGFLGFLVLATLVVVPILGIVGGGIACFVCAVTMPNPWFAHVGLVGGGLFLLAFGAALGGLMLDG